MTVETKMELTQDYITNYSKTQHEPDWLLEHRLRAFSLSQSLELPKIEKTNISSWNLFNFVHHTEDAVLEDRKQLPKEIDEALGHEEASSIIVHKNNTPVYQHQDEKLKEQGVIFTDLRTALKEHESLVRRYFAQLIKEDEHKLSALHASLFNCGIFLYVPKNTEVEIPVQSIWWQENGNAGILPHILIIAEENSKVTYMEQLWSAENGTAASHYAAEVFVGAGAKVTFAALDHFGSDVTNYVYRRAQVERDGRMEWAIGQMHDGNTVLDNITLLEGDGSSGDSKAVVVGRGKQSQNMVQKMVHIGKASDGTILVHGVLKDEARAIFNGISKMEKGASKANGEQTERVLMLGEQARGDANPILLIDEDDVMAGHAASAGQVDKMQLYYLMSRGIPREAAERLLILGFLNPVVEKIPLEGMKKQLVSVIERKVSS